MKVLITGNLGYVGASVMMQLRSAFPKATIVGFDLGLFSRQISGGSVLPETLVDIQYYGDIRRFPEHILEGMDAVVSLAAISNDPMGARFEKATMEINHRANIDLAIKAKKAGVKSFVFASSCSVYGFAEEGARNEKSAVNPLTAYAKSKVHSEEGLGPLADENFIVTCLRFATACGMSARLRLDLVLNDFVASAVAQKKIEILSDGSPWRPLIDTKDMARAVKWAITRKTTQGGACLIVNIGNDRGNYQIRELAEAVGTVIPTVRISINSNAQPDKRSYRVSFQLFKELAPNSQPQYGLIDTVNELKAGLVAMDFEDTGFRSSNYMRLKMLEHLIQEDLLDSQLNWKHGRRRSIDLRRNGTAG